MSEHRLSAADRRAHRKTNKSPKATKSRVDHRLRRAPSPDRWWTSVRLRALLSLGLVFGFGSAGTFAYWTDQAVVSGITIKAGTLDLKVSKNSPENYLNNITDYTDLNITNMVPGNSVAAIVKVKNVGDVGFTYTASTSVSNSTLANALDVKVTAGSVSGSSPSATCSGSALSGTASKLDQALITTSRTLAANAVDALCIQVTMPTTASTTLQGASTTVSYTFTATQ